ncbi:hypothetical protein SPRG_17413 [Saprolegnia parasitica CBS 223.65]|uniref:Uncharacterized protein n=1 Tax=Saprolegnia parasitica (strain CBS 223.65) TaxID=695850 RepID=A0A067BKH3_SAPPC|nr:hypothetical protein SPRG_17413 [Saprolegnia parasitica CBS 223.65]KDO17190.1 hypothetical protein SPRG_17413 [Saprolegnia parasitica CBS 223.65]|eukprot:XP_012212103.1 hypothetical protein SPRG_17413 [Saprolegnia parasitica CBS 223.65]
MSSRRSAPPKPTVLSMSSEGLASITFTVSDKRPKSAHHRSRARQPKPRDATSQGSPLLRKAATSVTPTMLMSANTNPSGANIQKGSFRKSTAWSEKRDATSTAKPRVRTDPNPRHGSVSPPKDTSPSPPRCAAVDGKRSPLQRDVHRAAALVVDPKHAVADIERVSGAKWDAAHGFVCPRKTVTGTSPRSQRNTRVESSTDGQCQITETWVQPSTRNNKRVVGVGARHQRSMQQTKVNSARDSGDRTPQARWL